MEIYNNYILKNSKEKVYFWDVIFNQEMTDIDPESVLQFLKNVVLNNNETLFCKMRALKEIISWTFLDKIKQRKTISFLLDEMINSNEESLECYRLKYLSLFYQREKHDIKDTLLKKSNEQNSLIKAEAKYQLGLIIFFDSNDLHNKKQFLDSIMNAKQIFEEVALIEENRIDAELLSLICSYINSCFIFDLESCKKTYQQIKELIFEGILLQIDDKISPVYLNIGQNISKLHKIINKNPDTWIDYKIEFNKLCADFYELLNFSYKNNDWYRSLQERMNERLKVEIIEPIFKYNYKATLSKIEVLLSQSYNNDPTTTFLNYLKEILLSEDIKEVNHNQEWFKKNFPMLTEDDWNSFNESVNQSNVSGAVYNLLNAMQKLTPEKVLDDIVSACIKLQANQKFKNCIEDERNDYIRDMLSSQKYDLRDQTRQGTSKEGKTSGENDLLIFNNNEPCCLFEALNLKSLDKGYIKEHIDKIYKYDTLGYRYNFLVSYVKIKDFSSFWTKYLDYIKEYEYPYPLDSFEENAGDKYYYPSLRVASTTLLRNEIKTVLYHICVLMQE